MRAHRHWTCAKHRPLPCISFNGVDRRKRRQHRGSAPSTPPPSERATLAHGFDEFMGSLCHLNAQEEFENPDYFKDPALIKKFQTRGVIHTSAMPDDTRKIESKGPLGQKRMETIND